MNNLPWQQFFHRAFLQQMKAAGLSADDCTRYAWRPREVPMAAIVGAERDRDLSRLALTKAEVQQAWDAPLLAPSLNRTSWNKQKIALVLMPGYTHETLRKHSWHVEVDNRRSPHHVVMLTGGEGEPPQEQVISNGDSGLKLLYAHYPRSNASSEQILDPLFHMLHGSDSLRRWVDEGYRLLFVGYSHGAPLSLELLADLNSHRWQDDFLLSSTMGFLGLCGDIGGSWLADDLFAEQPKLLNLHKVVAFAKRHKWFAKLAGLGTPQLMADIKTGAYSLGHEVRQTRLQDYGPRLPANLKYLTVSAAMPMADYRRRWWQFNLDDWTMFRQAKVSEPISVYNDGQVVINDHWLPRQAQIPENHQIHLGTVRTHHWGVSYRTFNLGRNRFPRSAFYRALLQTLLSVDEANEAASESAKG